MTEQQFMNMQAAVVDLNNSMIKHIALTVKGFQQISTLIAASAANDVSNPNIEALNVQVQDTSKNMLAAIAALETPSQQTEMNLGTDVKIDNVAETVIIPPETSSQPQSKPNANEFGG